MVEGCTIKENYAADGGGGIDVWRASIEIKNSTIENNTTAWGQAIQISTDDTDNFRPIVEFDNVDIINHRDSTISVIASINNSTISINNLSFIDNRDNENLFRLNNSDGTISGLTFERHTSRWSISFLENCNIQFENVIMSHCTGIETAGLVLNETIASIDTLMVDNCDWNSTSIDITGNSKLSLKNGNFNKVSSNSNGAAIYAWQNEGNQSNIKIFNTTFDSCNVIESGGAISLHGIDSLLIDGCTFTAKEKMRIALVQCGYADGIPRNFGNKGFVYFNDYVNYLNNIYHKLFKAINRDTLKSLRATRDGEGF